MEALVESIPKQETNAIREYLARYVFGISAKPNASQGFETVGTADTWLILIGRPNDLSGQYSSPVFCFYCSPVLVVVIGKTRVKTQNDDDRCP
jgi:hypothetical protein